MDSLTHIAIGACIGDLFLGKKIGKKAMIYGALAASLPDIDFIASFWLNAADDLMAHRGFTHSFLFALLVVLAMGFFLKRHHKHEKISIRTWLIFMGTAILSHLFLDVFNAYGIGWFEPFSHRRFSLNVIFVADPFFSLWPGVAAIALLVMHRAHKKRNAWSVFGLLFCSFYLCYGIFHKLKIDGQVRMALVQQGIPYKEFFTTPTPFNNWLWYAVAETDSGYQIGYRSVFDKGKHISFHYFSKNDSLLNAFRQQADCRQLIRFSQGYYTAEQSSQGIVFSDLRFGQMMGWQYPDAHFVFHYYLQDTDANHLVVQRGRFAHWNTESLKYFLKRIRGI